MALLSCKTLQGLADYNRVGSPAWTFRRKRFARFLELVNTCKTRSIRILDIGGTQRFWEVMGLADSEHHITTLNLFTEERRHDNIEIVVGDARCLHQFDDHQFDVVFSNSAIEHLFSFEGQKQMAAEVRRLGPKYFVQTPNYYFPVEPHFLFPGFQFLPFGSRVWLLRHFRLGWYDQRVDDPDQLRDLVREIRLLTKRELRILFPDASIFSERVAGLTKSYIAVRS